MSRSLIDSHFDALFERSTGAKRALGHRLELIRDSVEHEQTCLELIASAQHHILIDNYRICDDNWGRTLLAALCERAEAGVLVAVQCDWLGSFGQLGRAWVRTLETAGGHFNRFNTLGVGEPLAWLIRNHRKQLSIDGQHALVTGWCHSAQWRGRKPGDPWRDTGVRVSGPVVADIEQAFCQAWQLSGQPLPPLYTGPADSSGAAAVRLIAGSPQSSPLFRLDQTIINLCQQRLWITDAYPVGSIAYLDSLRRAAQSGVDVRLLVPGSSDLPLLGVLSRSSYRPLLLAGVRVFEWNGSMLHAKTAVADGCWSRVGSSNLNPASWLGNYELDLVVEDRDFAAQMETQFQHDLNNATEICLHKRQVKLSQPRLPKPRALKRIQSSASTLRASQSMALAVRDSRRLDATDAGLLGVLGGLGIALTVTALLVPEVVTWPLALITSLVSINILRIAWRRWRLYRQSEQNPS